MRWHRLNRLTGKANFAVVRNIQPRDCAERAGFTHAIAADKRDDLACIHLKVNL